MEHYEFISKTNSKILFNQIKYLVTCAKESYQNDLTTRREHLRELLDNEEKIYKDEFISKIKSRVDENIRERQESLLAIKSNRIKEVEKFVESKKLQQNMQNSIEIRDELRRKDNHHTQLCQLEQMDEKLRTLASQKEHDELWQKVQRRVNDNIDERQKYENGIKAALQENQFRILDKQSEDHRRLKEMDMKHFIEEKNALSQKIKASYHEEKIQAHAAKLTRSIKAKEAMSTICEQKKILEQEAKMFEQQFHAETMRQVRNEMEEALQKNRGIKESVLDYLAYVKRFNNFIHDQELKRDKAYDELSRRFTCYKDHPKRALAEKKRQAAETNYKILLNQISEDQARRVQLEAAERENKLIENRFAKVQLRDEKKERANFKKDLDLQLEEIDRLKAEKQAQFEEELYRAMKDQIYCEELLDKHKADGCDYLQPHPNWILLGGQNKDAECHGK